MRESVITQIPSTQYAIQIVGKGELVVNPTKPVDPVGPTQIMLEVEACGICFSDTRLLHQFDGHPRESNVVADIDLDALKDIPSYHPNQGAVTPGHEPVVRVMQVGEEITHFKVGNRLLVQADWKHLRIAKSNDAFGYNFDSALRGYAIVDEHCVMSPDSKEFPIHVSEGPSAAAVGPIGPWTTVEGSHAWTERNRVADDGRLLVVDEGDVDALTAEHKLAEVVRIATDVIGGVEGEFDDIVLFGADADAIKKAALLISTRDTMCVILDGERISHKASLDIDRAHYDFTRFCDAAGSNPRGDYAWIPANGDLRESDRYVFVGVAGPMGVIHTIRAATSGAPGLSVMGTDLSGERLKNPTKVIGPTAKKSGVPFDVVNTSSAPLEYGYTCTTYLVSVPALVSQTVGLLTEGSVLDAFAGIPTGTFGDFNLQGITERQIFVLGISGSDVSDMHAVLRKIEAGIIDAAISLWVITGMAGFGDATGAMMGHTSGGRIMVFPMIHGLSLTPVPEPAKKLPTIATKLDTVGL